MGSSSGSGTSQYLGGIKTPPFRTKALAKVNLLKLVVHDLYRSSNQYGIIVRFTHFFVHFDKSRNSDVLESAWLEPRPDRFVLWHLDGRLRGSLHHPLPDGRASL